MSRHSPILSVDMAAVTAALLAGGKLSSVAAEQGVSTGWLCHYASVAGLAHAWTTREERALLADLRAGRALVVRADAAPAAARLAQRIAAALDEYSRVPQHDSARNAANRGSAPASSQPRTNRTAADRGVVTAALAQR